VAAATAATVTAATAATATPATATAATATENLGLDRASLPLQAVKAGKFEGRYENALVELLNQKRKREPRDTGNVVNLMDALVGA
jgi:hypothetical protein